MKAQVMQEKCFGPVRFIPGKNNGKYPYCHSAYIEDACVLIDPASDRERLIELKKYPGVKMVWLTHWHEDHIMDLDLFDDVPLWISENDAPPLADLEVFLDWYGMDNEIRAHFHKMMIDQFHYMPRKPARLLKGGETINLGSVTVDVISTPGHTPGHLSFFFREPEVLLLGDYDLTKFGPWYGDRDSNIDDFIRSVKVLREAPAKVWLACHEKGLFEDDPEEIWDNYLGIIKKREDRILDLLKTPRTISELIDEGIVYGRPGNKAPLFVYGEKAIIEKHLERDIRNSIVVVKGDKFVKF